MVFMTNDIKSFIEKESAPIVICSTDNAGYWTGYYLNKCNVDFQFYVDDEVKNENTFCNGRPVYKFESLCETNRGGVFRLIVPTQNPDLILNKLAFLSEKFNLNFLCLLPLYKTSEKDVTYNINKMLGYFRKKLMKFELPTIIANECAVGRIYEQLDMAYISPLINTNLSYENFIKVCKNPKKYLVPIKNQMYWGYWYRSPTATEYPYVPAVKIDDVEIVFSHDNNLEYAKQRWNFLAEHCNFDRLIYVLVNSNGSIPLKVQREFANLKGEKLLMYYDEMFSYPSNEIPFVNRTKFVAAGEAIENYFDLVGWINKEYLQKYSRR